MKEVLKNIIFLTLLLLPVIVRAQHANRDSILALVKTAKHDSSRIAALLEAGNYYITKKSDSSVYYHTSALELAKSANSTYFQAASLIRLGQDYFVFGDYDKSWEFATQAMKMIELNLSNMQEGTEKDKYRKLYAAVFMNMGNIQMNKAQYDKAVIRFKYALKVAKEIGDAEQQVLILGNLGIVYRQLADHSNALNCFYSALRLSEGQRNNKSIARQHANIGIIYYDLKRYDESLKEYISALKIFEPAGLESEQSKLLCNIAIIYQLQGKTTEAINHFQKAIKLNEKDGNKVSLGNILSNVGSLYALRGEYASALENYLQALKLAQETHDKRTQSFAAGNIGLAYSKQKKFALAEKYLADAIDLAREIHAIDLLKEQYRDLSEVYEASNRPALSLNYYRKYITIRDSIFSEENTRKSIQQEMKFNYEKKLEADSVKTESARKVNAARIKKEETQRHALYGGLAAIVLFAVFMVKRYRLTIRQKNVIEKQKKLAEEQKRIVEQKQKEVLDSIRYAKRIQTALQASEANISNALKKLKKV